MEHADRCTNDITEQEREALNLFRLMTPGQRASTIGWMMHRVQSLKNKQLTEIRSA